MKKIPDKSPEEVRKFLAKLPKDRRIYYRLGPLLVEVSKEEALKLLEETSSQKTTEKEG